MNLLWVAFRKPFFLITLDGKKGAHPLKNEASWVRTI